MFEGTRGALVELRNAWRSVEYVGEVYSFKRTVSSDVPWDARGIGEDRSPVSRTIHGCKYRRVFLCTTPASPRAQLSF